MKSNNDPNIPTPKIDEQFWYDYSVKLVEGSIDRIDNNIDSINKLILWIYGIYTGSGLLSIQFIDIPIVVLILLALPYTLLLISQWKNTIAIGPASAHFTPDSDTSIRKAYEAIYTIKENQLIALKRLSFGAVALTGIALTSVFIISKLPAKTTYIELHVKSFTSKINRREIEVTGYVAKNDSNEYCLTIVSHTHPTVKMDCPIILLNKHYLITKSGEFQQTIIVDTCGKFYTATLEWSENGVRSIQQSTLKPLISPSVSTTSLQAITKITTQPASKTSIPAKPFTHTSPSTKGKRTIPRDFND